ncbi:MAG: membrane protein insertion efficiency factor YidD [Candidatus Omnitrophica bacterium]|nr:membrane protein insertion efficiency factor YidD [Candidatus Omnitrophota bacterium]
MKQALIAFIRAYKKVISPLFIRSCRFYPTCSDYAIEAIRKHGTIKGSAMSVWRLLRCNPFSRGGFDPVSEKSSNQF